MQQTSANLCLSVDLIGTMRTISRSYAICSITQGGVYDTHGGGGGYIPGVAALESRLSSKIVVDMTEEGFKFGDCCWHKSIMQQPSC